MNVHLTLGLQLSDSLYSGMAYKTSRELHGLLGQLRTSCEATSTTLFIKDNLCQTHNIITTPSALCCTTQCDKKSHAEHQTHIEQEDLGMRLYCTLNLFIARNRKA